MSTAIISFTRNGAGLAEKLGKSIPNASLYTIDRLAQGLDMMPMGSLSQWTKVHFQQEDALIFVSAAGIAVRAIAPFVRDKFTDPAVVSVDEQGRFAVPLLSGHVGGGNALAAQVAAITGGTAVISTATDANGVFAVDVWAKSQGLVIGNRELAKRISAALLEGERVGFASDFPVSGELPVGLVSGLTQKYNVLVSVKNGQKTQDNILLLHPKALVLGIGCKKHLPQDHVERIVRKLMEENHLAMESVCQIASIDLKAEDEGIRRLAEHLQVERRFFTADELNAVEGEFTPSTFVSSITGVDNVCERSAVLASGGQLILKKCAREGVTLAAALRSVTLTF